MTSTLKPQSNSEEKMQGIDEVLGDLVIHIISQLDPNDTARVACVNTKFRVWASEDFLWSFHCSNDLALSSPIDPFGKPLPSFKVAYQLWREAFSMYPWSLVKRVKRCWDRLKNWLENNFPEVLGTLRRGVSEEKLDEVEKDLNLKIPLPTRLLYRMHDGQNQTATKFFGLLGGYHVYDHLVNVHFLPLTSAVKTTDWVTHELDFSSTSKYLLVASSFLEAAKFLFLNCVDMQLYVDSFTHREEQMMPCVPDALLKSSGDQQCDGLLLWLEEHARRLESGMISVREEGHLKAICQFPEKPPLCSTAITNGVKVRASAVLVPEESDFQNNFFTFAYSIRMSLLPEGCTIYGMKFDSCQLYWRHWIIRENEIIKNDINAEAVIGKYPLLLPGEQEFIYQSRTTQRQMPGSIEGSFTFVPGSLAEPKGDEFEVEVARFPLVMPDYIF